MVCRYVLGFSLAEESDRLNVRYKIWIEVDGRTVVGGGGIRLLEAIGKYGSIKDAADSLMMSYKYAWQYIRKIEERLGRPVVETFRGGKHKGGAKLTEEGLKLIECYRRAEGIVKEALSQLEEFVED